MRKSEVIVSSSIGSRTPRFSLNKSSGFLFFLFFVSVFQAVVYNIRLKRLQSPFLKTFFLLAWFLFRDQIVPTSAF